MEYITAREAAAKWGVSGRAVTYHLAAGRIPGAVKKGKLWLIPANAQRPDDQRRRRQDLPEQLLTRALSADLTYVFTTATQPFPGDNPDAILDALDEDRLQLIYEAELAYLRGDFARAAASFHQTEGDDAARLRVCPLAVAAAISRGDYPAYTEIDAYLKSCTNSGKGKDFTALAELSLATVAVSCIAPNMAPAWLKIGDLSALAPLARPYALYLRAKYLLCLAQFDATLAVAQTALALSSPEAGITTTDIYLQLTCAIACQELKRADEAKGWLLSAMRLALPHGFITPFAEIITSLGGLMEQCLEREFPNHFPTVIAQWKNTWKNWMTFHNRFTKDNITLILSLREYHIAVLAARRIPYARIAQQYNISLGRLKNIMLEIYDKLSVSSREELAKYIL